MILFYAQASICQITRFGRRAIAASSTAPFGRSLLGLEDAGELRNAAGLIPCPTYANDAAADADAALLSGTFYRTTAGARTVYRKP